MRRMTDDASAGQPRSAEAIVDLVMESVARVYEQLSEQLAPVDYNTLLAAEKVLHERTKQTVKSARGALKQARAAGEVVPLSPPEIEVGWTCRSLLMAVKQARLPE